LRQAVPEVFSAENDRDRVMVALPLSDILARLNPALITRRRTQRQVEVPSDISSPFDANSPGLVFSVGPAKPEPEAPVLPPSRPNRLTPPLTPPSPLTAGRRTLSSVPTPPAATLPANPVIPQAPHRPATTPPPGFPKPSVPAAPIAPQTPAAQVPHRPVSTTPAKAVAPATPVSQPPPAQVPLRAAPMTPAKPVAPAAPTSHPPAGQVPHRPVPMTPAPAKPAAPVPAAPPAQAPIPMTPVRFNLPPNTNPRKTTPPHSLAAQPPSAPPPAQAPAIPTGPIHYNLAPAAPAPRPAPAAPVAPPPPALSLAPETPLPAEAFEPEPSLESEPSPEPEPALRLVPDSEAALNGEPAADEAIALGPPGEPLVASLSSLAEGWPEPVRKEIVDLGLAEADVALPPNAVEQALRQGRIVFSWKTIRSWIHPAVLATTSAQDTTVLELPLRVVAPLFLERQAEAAKNRPRIAIDEEIPNLFFGFPQAEPTAGESAVTPDRPASNRPMDTNYYVWDESTDMVKVHESETKRGPSPGTKFVAKYATPNEVVSKASSLDGVAGALIALPDGLMVASRLSGDLNGDTLAAFLPQIFGKVSQCTKELRMGELNNLNFTVGNVPWKIFRVNAIFFAAFGRAGEPLPTAQLAALAGELDHKPK